MRALRRQRRRRTCYVPSWQPGAVHSDVPGASPLPQRPQRPESSSWLIQALSASWLQNASDAIRPCRALAPLGAPADAYGACWKSVDRGGQPVPLRSSSHIQGARAWPSLRRWWLHAAATGTAACRSTPFCTLACSRWLLPVGLGHCTAGELSVELPSHMHGARAHSHRSPGCGARAVPQADGQRADFSRWAWAGGCALLSRLSGCQADSCILLTAAHCWRRAACTFSMATRPPHPPFLLACRHMGAAEWALRVCRRQPCLLPHGSWRAL